MAPLFRERLGLPLSVDLPAARMLQLLAWAFYLTQVMSVGRILGCLVGGRGAGMNSFLRMSQSRFHRCFCETLYIYSSLGHVVRPVGRYRRWPLTIAWPRLRSPNVHHHGDGPLAARF